MMCSWGSTTVVEARVDFALLTDGRPEKCRTYKASPAGINLGQTFWTLHSFRAFAIGDCKACAEEVGDGFVLWTTCSPFHDFEKPSR